MLTLLRGYEIGHTVNNGGSLIGSTVEKADRVRRKEELSFCSVQMLCLVYTYCLFHNHTLAVKLIYAIGWVRERERRGMKRNPHPLMLMIMR